MGSSEKRRLSPSLALSVVALFVALSGSAIALSGSRNVDHNDLRKHVVHAKNIHTGAVNGAKVADDALDAADLAPDAVGQSEISTSGVAAPEIATNAVGDAEIAANAVDQDEIENGSVGAAELASDAVTTAKLNGVTGVITHNFPELAATSCAGAVKSAPGVTPSDNIILTPDSSANQLVVWQAFQMPTDNQLWLNVCNPHDLAINPPDAAFRYLAIHP